MAGEPNDTGKRGADAENDVVTLVLDRRSAENLYYSLALCLGGVGRPLGHSLLSKKGKGKGKGNGKGKVPKSYGKPAPKTSW